MGLFLAAALVGYNNLRPALGGIQYVSVNLVVGAALAFVAVRFLGSTPEELGLRGNRVRFAAAAGGAAIVLVSPLFAFALFDTTAHWVADDRIAGFDASDAAFHALVRIPLGTALFEEFAFRGVLLGILSRRGALFGTIGSSVAFGLWHIRPTLDVVNANTSDPQALMTAFSIAGAVLLTAAAGFGFWWLRVKGGGIAAPVAFHAGLNSLSLVAAALAHARIG